MFGRRRTPSARPSLLMFCIDRPIARISSSLVLYRVPRSVLSLWQRYNRRDSYRVSTVDVPESASAQLVNDSSRGVTPCIIFKNDGVLYQQVLHAVSENILVYYDIVPLQFWSRNVALVIALALSVWKSAFYRLQYIDSILSPVTVLTRLTVLVHVHKAGSSRTHHRHVTAVFPVLFIQPLYVTPVSPWLTHTL